MGEDFVLRSADDPEGVPDRGGGDPADDRGGRPLVQTTFRV